MSVIATAVKHLIAAGVTGDALISAIAEMESAQQPAKSSGAARQARYRDRIKERNGDVTSVTETSPSDGFPNPSLTSPTPTKEKPPKGVKKKKLPLPEWIPVEEWRAFEEMRMKMKKPMTDRARALAFARLEKFKVQGFSPQDVLNHCTLNCYQGIFKPKDERNENNAKNYRGDGFKPKPNLSESSDRVIDAIYRGEI